MRLGKHQYNDKIIELHVFFSIYSIYHLLLTLTLNNIPTHCAHMHMCYNAS